MKNFYALNAGEFFVAQEILRRRKDLQLYFPLKDIGIDLLAVSPKSTRPVSIQVKESRIYPQGYSWHQIRAQKIQDADIFVFISYIPTMKGGKTIFDMDYAVIPREDLEKMCTKKAANRGKYSFYFAAEGIRLLDLRDGRADVTAYHRAWNLI